MKCVCGYDCNDDLKNEQFLKILVRDRSNTTQFYHFYDKVELYACPKCKTVQAKI